MKIPFKFQILFFFVGLLILTLGSIAFFTFQWVSKRAEEDIQFRLAQSMATLKLIYKNDSATWARQYQSLAVDPRLRALAQIKDKQTLQLASAEVREEFNGACFGFFTPEGKLLAWDGDQELGNKVAKHIKNKREKATEIFLVRNQVYQIVRIGMGVGQKITGCIVGGRIIDSSVLDTYSLTLGTALSLYDGNSILASSKTINLPIKENLRTSALPLPHSLRIVLHIDPELVTAQLQDTFHVVFYLATSCILFGGVVAIWLANKFSYPIQSLARMTMAVEKGDMGVRAKEEGAPELKLLARNFNRMIESIGNYQHQLTAHAKHLEMEIEQKTKQSELLDKEVSQHKLTLDKLQKALRAAEAATQAKSEFLANMSHELRTPIHGIVSFSEFGLEKYLTAKPEKIRHYFLRINESAESLICLVNNLLDLSILQARRSSFNFKENSIDEIIERIVEECECKISERKLVLKYHPKTPKIIAEIDGEKISQVIRNLLVNAIKFSNEGGRIEMETDLLENQLMFSILDQGIGIPEDEMQLIFDKFSQSSKTKTGSGGTGLGLSICFEIIRAHHGKIWAEHNPDGGSILFFKVPLIQCGSAQWDMEKNESKAIILT